jgi:uncharacterized SAM-binding protein YcdF (DUF218 family)
VSIAGSPLLARIRNSLFTERAASALIAATLLGVLAGELGVGLVLPWDYDILDVMIFAVVCAIGASFSSRGQLVRVLWIADAILIALAVFIDTPVTTSLATHWVRADSLPSGGVDAVVVPSSTLTSSATLTAVGSDRLLSGLELIRRGVAPRLVTTRVTCCGRSRTVSSDADQRRLIEMAGVADRWILVGEAEGSTHAEALAVDRRLRELGARTIAVVTSPLHTRRACATFERDGMRVTCIPSAERGDQTRAPGGARNRTAAFRTYVYERLGWWLYRRRGWVTG